MRILLSFHYLRGRNLRSDLRRGFGESAPELFVDSGAFSAATQGVEIDIGEYCAFVQEYADLIEVYSNLDVIGDPKATFRNQCEMERRGLSPLPVFHVGGDWSYLERYIERYSYIALGGRVPYFSSSATKRVMPWLVRCFRMAQGRTVYTLFGNGTNAGEWPRRDNLTKIRGCLWRVQSRLTGRS